MSRTSKYIKLDLYPFRIKPMANTKLTKAKQQEGCPFCDKPVNEPWQDHVILCSGQKHKCLTCGVRFKKKNYLLKHMKLQ